MGIREGCGAEPGHEPSYSVRILHNGLDVSLNFIYEADAESGAFVLVVQCRVVQFTFRESMKGDSRQLLEFCPCAAQHSLCRSVTIR